MNTITFGNKNSYTDFGLLLKSREIGEAEPRTNYVDVPARDGLLDFTEAFGEVKYKNRTHVFIFQYTGKDSDWQAMLSALTNYLHGQKHKIYFEENYYWVGRCFVKAAQSKNGIREIEVEADCEPYKYRLDETIIDVTASGQEILTPILNDRKTVTPRVQVMEGTPTLSWKDAKTGAEFRTTLGSGFDNKILDFKFYAGANAFTVGGTGRVKLTFRQASL